LLKQNGNVKEHTKKKEERNRLLVLRGRVIQKCPNRLANVLQNPKHDG